MNFLYALPAPLLLIAALTVVIAVALTGQAYLHHRFDAKAFVAHNEVGGVIVTVVASLYAVLLGFMTVVSWEHFQDARAIVVAEADASIGAWHTAVGLPPAVRSRVRVDIDRYAEIMVSKEWDAMRLGRSETGAAMLVMDAMDATGGFEPAGARESNAQNLTMQQLGLMHDLRQRRVAANDSGLSGFEWIVLLIGAVLIITFCWLFGGTKPTVQLIMTATVVTMLVATLVLLFELQYPFRSGIGIDNGVWVGALDHLREMMSGTMPDMRN